MAHQPGQELLQETIYKDKANPQSNKTYYYDQDPVHISERKAFYSTWKKRQDKDKRTYLSAGSVFSGRIGWGIKCLGVEYEATNGLILNWDICNIDIFSRYRATISSLFSIGYNWYPFSCMVFRQ